jgi:stage II sporulation protein D
MPSVEARLSGPGAVFNHPGRDPNVMQRPAKIAALALVALLLSTGAAQAKWIVPGKGYGHGVGMSQYGAFGFAKHGRNYKQILRHYYTGVRIDRTRTREVRVLIDVGGSLRFSGARRACGRDLARGKEYLFTPKGSRTVLRRAGGKRLAGCGKEGVASGGSTVRMEGVGTYRGKLAGRNVGGSIFAINEVGIEGYVQGVIPNEVPSSWPKHALRAQAVAARSYALATRLDGDGYDLYDDTRSQVYGGRSSETAATNKASDATAREVIKDSGDVATAFFFSTSGGRTENSEFGFAGGSPRPYLKSVKDPFDDASPLHSWRARFSNSEMESKLSGLFSGNLKRIRVKKTGVSPRIVKARVVGSSGSSTVTGDTLRFRLGLRSTWARFRKR